MRLLELEVMSSKISKQEKKEEPHNYRPVTSPTCHCDVRKKIRERWVKCFEENGITVNPQYNGSQYTRYWTYQTRNLSGQTLAKMDEISYGKGVVQ